MCCEIVATPRSLVKEGDPAIIARVRIIGTGIDIVEIDRIRGLWQRHRERFLSRVYTPEERGRLDRLADPAPYLAGRWAVKEAVLKALGTGLSQGITWKDINVVRDPTGAPRVVLAGLARSRARDLGMGRILVSITHGRDLAVAHAMGVVEDGLNDFTSKTSGDGP
jgi:holo-[acyl-carrier protein] synthase